jgi:hypothetical protein
MKEIAGKILEALQRPNALKALASGGDAGWMALVALGAMALSAFAIYEIMKVTMSH